MVLMVLDLKCLEKVYLLGLVYLFLDFIVSFFQLQRQINGKKKVWGFVATPIERVAAPLAVLLSFWISLLINDSVLGIYVIMNIFFLFIYYVLGNTFEDSICIDEIVKKYTLKPYNIIKYNRYWRRSHYIIPYRTALFVFQFFLVILSQLNKMEIIIVNVGMVNPEFAIVNLLIIDRIHHYSVRDRRKGKLWNEKSIIEFYFDPVIELCNERVSERDFKGRLKTIKTIFSESKEIDKLSSYNQSIMKSYIIKIYSIIGNVDIDTITIEECQHILSALKMANRDYLG